MTLAPSEVREIVEALIEIRMAAMNADLIASAYVEEYGEGLLVTLLEDMVEIVEGEVVENSEPFDEEEDRFVNEGGRVDAPSEEEEE